MDVCMYVFIFVVTAFKGTHFRTPSDLVLLIVDAQEQKLIVLRNYNLPLKLPITTRLL
jgi:membrane-anchored protein YejM (alkaline phosphatase superfamily)